MPDGLVWTEHGRVGATPTSHPYPCGSVTLARRKLQEKVREKLTKNPPYTCATVDSMPASALNFAALGDQEDEVQNLLAQIQSDWHRVTPLSLIEFDAKAGQFRHPLGVVNRQTIQDADIAIRQVDSCIGGREGLEAAVEAYLKIIPLPVGRQLNPCQLLGNPNQIAQQLELLSKLSLGLDRIDQIRRIVQDAANEMVEYDRSHWLTWGNSEVDSQAGSETLNFEDDRTLGLTWSQI